MTIKFYDLGDYLSLAEREKFGLEGKQPLLGYDNNPGRKIRAVRAGEKRPPLKGEWYISGAFPCAYKALNDLTYDYEIARLVLVESRIVTTILA